VRRSERKGRRRRKMRRSRREGRSSEGEVPGLGSVRTSSISW